MSAATTSVSAAPVPRVDAQEAPWPKTSRLDWSDRDGYHVRCELCPLVEILAGRAEQVLHGRLLEQGRRWAIEHSCRGAGR